MKRVTAAILDRRGKRIEPVRNGGLEIPEEGAAPKILRDTVVNVGSDGLEKWVPRGNPFQCWVIAKDLLVEHHALILAPKPTKSRLEPFTDRGECFWHPSNLVHVRVASN